MEEFSTLSVKLYEISKITKKINNKLFDTYSLRSAHILFMMEIDVKIDGLTPTEIAKLCYIDKAFVSRISADLLKAGLIQYNEKFEDGRKYKRKFILTPTGKAVIREINKPISDAISRLSNRYSDYDIRNFLSVLSAIGDNMAEEAEKYIQ